MNRKKAPALLESLYSSKEKKGKSIHISSLIGGKCGILENLKKRGISGLQRGEEENGKDGDGQVGRGQDV